MLKITEEDLRYRLTHQPNPNLAQPEVHELRRPSAPTEPSLVQIMRALEDADIDTSWGLDVLSLYPEHKAEILPIYYKLFPTLDVRGRILLASAILNLKPSRKDASQLLDLFREAQRAGDAELLWVLSQALAPLVDAADITQLRLLLETPGKHRIFFAQQLHKAQDKEAAYALALDLLGADEFETVAGALDAVKKMKRSLPEALRNRLVAHPAPYIRTQIKKFKDT